MTLRKRELSEAKAELRGAALSYEERREGLGVAFLDAIDAAINAILTFPDAWRPYPGWEREPPLRTGPVEGFPYRIVYLIDGQDIVILAYPHDRQLPGYWMNRVTP